MNNDPILEFGFEVELDIDPDPQTCTLLRTKLLDYAVKLGIEPEAYKAFIAQKGAPCSSLLTDPYNTLMDKDKWSTHICCTMMVQSTEDWVSHKRVANDAALRAWSVTWPLPIGQRAMLYDWPNWKLLLPESFKAQSYTAFNMAVFQGLEYAFLALSIPVEAAGVTVDMFGLATPQPHTLKVKHDLLYASKAKTPNPTWGGGVRGVRRAELGETEPNASLSEPSEDYQELYDIGPLAWRITGRDPGHGAVTTLIKRANRWWKQFEGQPLRGSIYAGRPKGTGYFRDREEFTQAVATATRTLRRQGRNLTQDAVAAYFSQHDGFPTCSDRQLRIWLARYNLNWEDLKEAG